MFLNRIWVVFDVLKRGRILKGYLGNTYFKAFSSTNACQGKKWKEIGCVFDINFHHQVSLRRKDKQLVAATEKVFVNKFVPVVVFVVMVAFL